jgi:hypothetical protein
MKNKWIRSSIILLPILYAGILFGVSFFATSVKFLAPLLTLPIAIDVGNVTFHALIKLEWLLAFTCLLALIVNSPSKSSYILIFTIITILTIQTLELLPTLDQRVILIQQGHVIEKSYYHLVYIVLDFIKLASLLGITISRIHNSN